MIWGYIQGEEVFGRSSEAKAEGGGDPCGLERY